MPENIEQFYIKWYFTIFFKTIQALLGNKQNSYSVNGHVILLKTVLILLKIWKKGCLLFRTIFSLERLLSKQVSMLSMGRIYHLL